MGRRSKRAARCTACRMLQELCVCDLVPAIRCQGHWIVVQHPSEQHKTTNTGHLAARALLGSQLCTVRSRTEPPTPPFRLDTAAWLLFPGEDCARPADLPDGASVVVPDGTWAQVRKMVRTNAALADLPRVGLPEGAHARWSLREETSATGMSTLDAVCWLLAALEGPEVAAPLEELAQAMWARTLASRGVRPG